MNNQWNRTLLGIMLTALVLLIAQNLWPQHYQLKPTWMALIVAVVLALLNRFVKPVLLILTIPVTIITLGLFLLAINAIIILIAREMLEPKFYVTNFWWALLLGLFISIANGFVNGNVQVKRNVGENDQLT